MRITKREVTRYTIAGLLGAVVATLASTIETATLAWAFQISLSLSRQSAYWWNALMSAVFFVLPFAFLGCLVAVSTYHLILKPKADAECRCRRCGYILKGLSKPECSECGAVI